MKSIFKLFSLVVFVLLVSFVFTTKVQACSGDGYGGCVNPGSCPVGFYCSAEGLICTCELIQTTNTPIPTPTKTPTPQPTFAAASPTPIRPTVPATCTQSIECTNYCVGSPCGSACSAKCNTTTKECATTCTGDQDCPDLPPAGGNYGPWGPCGSSGYQARYCAANPQNYQIQVCPTPGNTGGPGSTSTPVPPPPTVGPSPTLGAVPTDPVLTLGAYNTGNNTTPITITWTGGTGLQVWDSTGTWWFNGADTSPTTINGFPSGITVNARTTFDFITFSETVSIFVPVPTTAPTPTPTTGPWIKLKDTSYISDNNLNNNIPLAPVAFDADDSTLAYFIINSGGATKTGGIVAGPNTNINGINLTAKTNERDWDMVFFRKLNRISLLYTEHTNYTDSSVTNGKKSV